ncbi:glycosyltransferase, partial [candidate division KSB1 bacterium]|nr:glycosyltransferase [candidate division KSB1 bacterium]
MPTTLLILLACLVLLYVITLFYFYRGFRFLNYPRHDGNPLPTVSVIIPARNEAHHIDELFKSLRRQNYPPELLEFCIIDDRSDDETFARIETGARELKNVIPLRIIDTVPHVAPKKRAIDLGIRRSSGEIILVTDADCRPGENWVRSFATRFSSDVVMVCGYAPYHPRRSFLHKLLALDFFSLAAVSAAGIGIGVPLTCAGGNLAYRRRAYYAIGGFEKIASFISGDDDLLLHEMHHRRVGKILYVPEPEAAVQTELPHSWRQFFWQRIRFASKSRHYDPKMTAALAAVYFMNLLLGCGLLASLALGKWPWLGGILFLWAIKALAELILLKRSAHLFGEQQLLLYLPLANILHPFYIIL